MLFNILIVDDSRTVRNMVHRVLEMAQVPINELFEAGNGEEGLAVLERHWIDLVFTDLFMPKMTGIEMIEKMASKDLLTVTPVVVISSEGNTHKIEALKGKGIRGYIRKPFTPEDMKAVVEDVLAHAV